MDKIKYKYEQMTAALLTLQETLQVFNLLKEKGQASCTYIGYKQEYRIHRDSVIQRFEYCTDLFWKFLKIYCETTHIATGIKIPSEVIRAVFEVGLVTEQEAEAIFEMIKGRNITSHTYIEKIAEQLASEIPAFYTVMNEVVQRIEPKN